MTDDKLPSQLAQKRPFSGIENIQDWRPIASSSTSSSKEPSWTDYDRELNLVKHPEFAPAFLRLLNQLATHDSNALSLAAKVQIQLAGGHIPHSKADLN